MIKFLTHSLSRSIQYPVKDNRIWWDLYPTDERLDWRFDLSQDEYIEILFIDCGFSGSQKRAWLLAEYGVKYTDELAVYRKHLLIERLKAMKAEGREPAAPREDTESGSLFE